LKRFVVSFILAMICSGAIAAQDRNLRLSVSSVLVESGLLKHILPRFSLKTAIRIDLVNDGADVVLADQGAPVLQGNGQVYAIHIAVGGPKAERFVGWLNSDIGQRTITAFKRDGKQMFTGAADLKAAAPKPVFTGDILAGETLSFTNCGRCHVIGPKNRMNGVGSTPSFALMRSFPDWQRRFETFFTLRPHPSFTQITDVTEPFPANLPPSIVPLEISVDDLESILAFVATIEPADLGAPIVHQ